jgi:HPt (histidine-containing phosphotransfer) domain-containing protein
MAQASLNTLLAQEIYGLDIAEGLERFDNDGEAYLNILRSYTANVRSLLTSIETVNEESLSNYHITVHGIKGASLNINANQVGQSAASLEQAAKSGDFRYIEKYNPAFIGAAQKLVYDIDAALSLVDDVKPQKHVKDKPDSESLTGLLEACDNYDLNGIEKAMAEIEKYKYDADDGLVEWLRENIALLNLTHIVEKLANLV